MRLPEIVSPSEWRVAQEKLLAREKEATRTRDALAAERRWRLPMVRFDKDHVFGGPSGDTSLLDMFEGRRQLIVYDFMFQPGALRWASSGCDGCSMLAMIERYRKRMGWTLPWFSLAGNDFNDDCGVTSGFGLSAFLRDGDRQEDREDSPEDYPQTSPYEWSRRHDEYQQRADA